MTYTQRFFRYPIHVLLIITALALVSSCASSSDSGTTDTASSTDQDISQYEALTTSLEGHRTQFLGEDADEFIAIGNTLYYKVYAGSFEAKLHSYNHAVGKSLTYGFPIGEDYRASANTIVTATRDGNDLYYRAYAADQANSLLGELHLEAPKSEQRYWAFNVSNGILYYVTTENGTDVMTWDTKNPSSAPVKLLNMESDLGMNVGEFQDFAIDASGKMLAVESGRLWTIDLTARSATWTHNETSVDAFSYDNDGILYRSAAAPYFYAYSDQSSKNIKQAIANSGYKLNTTFADAHQYSANAVRYKQWVVYKASSGIFVYDMTQNKISPVLLTPRGLTADGQSLTYNQLAVLDDGTLYIQGLLGSPGSTGADGPIYTIAASDWAK